MLCVLGYLLGSLTLALLSSSSAGVDVFRLNFSHGEHEEKLDLIDKIRDIEDKYRLDPVHALHSSELKQRYVRIRLRIQCS